MPSLSAARNIANRKNGNASTIGQIHKTNADFAMEYTWDTDINSKCCYIYDYYHDDQPDICRGMTYENTTKTMIDAKVMISAYGSLAKDQPELQVMFKPSQIFNFQPGDDLFYMNKYHERYYSDLPVGMYLDAPNRDGVYKKYLICLKDVSSQFQKYFILPVTYQLHWIGWQDGKRIKRKMWSVLRSQSSYNSGLWRDNLVTTRENQDKIFMPLNPISETLKYVTLDSQENQRLIVDIPTENPNVWQVSKIEHIHPFGLHKLTIYQTEFDPHSDYLELDENGRIIAMWADYNKSLQPPVDENPPADESLTCVLSATTPSIKIGGSYRTITAVFSDDGMGKKYKLTKENWSCFIDDEDYTDSDLVTWLETDDNQVKIKLANDRSYLSKILTIVCTVGKSKAHLKLEILS